MDLNNILPITNTIISKQIPPTSNHHHPLTAAPSPLTATPSHHQLPSSPLPHHHDHQHNHQTTCNCIHHKYIPSLPFTKNATSINPTTILLQLPLKALCKHECMCTNHKLVKIKNIKSCMYLIEIE